MEKMSRPPDRIEIKDLLLRAIVGIKPDERVKKQDVLLNIVFATDIGAAAASDDIVETVNYRSVTKQIIELVGPSYVGRLLLLPLLLTGLLTLCAVRGGLAFPASEVLSGLVVVLLVRGGQSDL